MAERSDVLERLLRQPPPGMDHPAGLRFTPDASALTYLQADDGSNVRALWRHDLATGRRRVLARARETAADHAALSRDEELERQRRRESGLGITAYTASAHADLLAIVVGGACLVSRDGGDAAPLPGWTGVQAAHPSPDGARVAIVRDGDLWVVELGSGAAARLTTSAGEGRFNGLAEYIAAEELDRFSGTWWSADGGAIAWAAVDERDVPEAVVGAASASGHEGKPEMLRYPFAGAANARVSLWTATLEQGSPAEVDLEIGDGYLARVVEDPTGGWLVAVLPRSQRTLRWWRVQPGARPLQLWEEAGSPWIELDSATRVLADGRIVRATEATGFRHLELRRGDGTFERRLTGGAWVVTALAGVDDARGEVLAVATADGVLERHLYAIPLDAPQPVERPERLTGEPGWHEVVVAADGSRWTDSWSTRRVAPRVVVRSRRGGKPLEIHAPSATAEAVGLVVPELETVLAADGTTELQVARLAPRGAGKGPPPAVAWVYGGPHAQHVRESWELTIHPVRQALADAGVAVVMADGRGTANRGVDFAAALAGALGTVELDDQVAMVEQLAARGALDPRRVGITGWSYGGYMACRALLRHPDRFRAAVAGAPVVAWDGYDSAYTERYLGTPAHEAEAYRQASLLDDAGALRRPLLLIHGTLDENVHRRHTDRLLAALDAAGQRAEVLFLEGQRHRPQTRSATLLRDRSTVAFLCRSLGVEPPAAPADPDGGEPPRGQAAS